MNCYVKVMKKNIYIQGKAMMNRYTYNLKITTSIPKVLSLVDPRFARLS